MVIEMCEFRECAALNGIKRNKDWCQSKHSKYPHVCPDLTSLRVCVFVVGADRAGLCIPGEARLGETWLVQQRRTCSCETQI